MANDKSTDQRIATCETCDSVCLVSVLANGKLLPFSRSGCGCADPSFTALNAADVTSNA